MSNATQTPATRPAKSAATPLSEATKLLLKYAQIDQEIEKAKDFLKQQKEQQDAVKAQLQAWSQENATEFGGKKTLGLNIGSIGFKAGPRKLVLPLDLNLKWYMSTMEAELPAAVTKVVDAKLVITGLDHNPDLAKALRKRGIDVTQEDYFTVSIKK
ncbi:host-nuclease inhibitor Gam family protein [Hymenobacter rubripertinctus]|uniref:host-nuclease inhibitor Gam family protein n=1 Tax=Hymenobacter rubripertinctus TaxID=2029981 RepID=UPI003645375D